jgi:hypothetical protein
MAVIDIAMRSHAANKEGIVLVGDAFYDERRKAAWASVQRIGRDGQHELWMGYRQTVIMTSQGAQVQIDRAATTMMAPANLLDLIAFQMGRPKERLRIEDMRKADGIA